MHIVITGASSFLGRACIRKLQEHGHDVTAFRHSYNEEPPENVPEQADIWVHFAWAGEGSEGRSDPAIQQYNLEMSMDALEKAISMGCRKFIFAGSQAEYGRAQDGGPKKEDGPVAPVSEYGRAKELFSHFAFARAEAYNASEECKRPLRYVHMRLFSVYGPGDHPGSLINTLVECLAADSDVELGPCRQLWNYLYIDDAAEAVAVLCEKFTSGVYNVGSCDTRPLREYVEEAHDIIAEATSKAREGWRPAGVLHFESRGDNAEGAADLSPDITKLQLTGFTPQVSFADGIRKILEAKGLIG